MPTFRIITPPNADTACNFPGTKCPQKSERQMKEGKKCSEKNALAVRAANPLDRKADPIYGVRCQPKADHRSECGHDVDCVSGLLTQRRAHAFSPEQDRHAAV